MKNLKRLNLIKKEKKRYKEEGIFNISKRNEILKSFANSEIPNCGSFIFNKVKLK